MGRGVVCYLASRHPEAVKDLFLTDVGFAGSLVAAQDDTLSADELAYKKAATEWMKMDGAYIDGNYPVIQYSEMLYGGHFTAMEAPAPFADALIEFTSKLKNSTY